jgi:hypothetical protein
VRLNLYINSVPQQETGTENGHSTQFPHLHVIAIHERQRNLTEKGQPALTFSAHGHLRSGAMSPTTCPVPERIVASHLDSAVIRQFPSTAFKPTK